MYHNSLYIYLIAFFAIGSSTVFSQISEGGIPPSFSYQSALRSASLPTSVPVDFYIEDLHETDYWQARDGAPLPVAKLIPVDYTMDNSGYHTVLPGGEKIWRLHLQAKDAVAVMLFYKDFYIPEGGRLFIYSPDKSQLLGAYTHRTHPSGGLFATEFIGCGEVILEYVASETSDETPRLSITEIGYGYNSVALRVFCNINPPPAGSCEVNINCEEGNAWQKEKKSVCYMIQKIGNKCYICTGSLMNNTAEDFKPLILTALHCGYDNSKFVPEADLAQWLFYFHKELEACDNRSLAVTSKTMTGCTILASTGKAGGSDGMLLQLNDMIPENYDVYYNGWDCSGEPALYGVGIHHPSGDNKKISTFDDPAKSYTFMSDEFTGDTYAHWNVIFKATPNGYGVTEAGSSGSPLYNENKLVTGTLTGGNSSCTLQRGVNLYGKLNYHWDRYKTDATTRMDVWLDPLNTGVKTFPGRFMKISKPSPQNLKAVNLGQSVSLTWSAPEGNETPKRYNIYRNNIKIAETSSLSCKDDNPVSGSLIYSVSAVYNNNEESGFATTTLSYVKYKAPTDFKAQRSSYESDQVELNWKAPVYEQTIFWGTMDPFWMVGFDTKQWYFGQRWSSDDTRPLNNTTIKAVQFFPMEKNVYEIYISQGEKTYRQPINNASLVQRSLNTIDLNTPFVIDGDKSLIISIYVSQAVSDYPAVCDDGPVVSAKGNLVSFDGIEWNQYSDYSDSDNSSVNFIVSAIVSSENINLSLQSKSNDVTKQPDVTTVVNKNPLARKAMLPLEDHSISLHSAVPTASSPVEDYPVSLRSAMPAVFPEIKKYRIYRNGSLFREVNAPETTCTDVYRGSSTYYEITAVYNDSEGEKDESERSERVNIVVVENTFIEAFASVQIFPTRFTDYLSLQGHELVKRVEVMSVSGKVCLVVTNPDKSIHTSSLAPGLYFIRIYDLHNNQKVIKAIKVN